MSPSKVANVPPVNQQASSSPQSVSTPTSNHFYSSLLNMKPRELKKLSGKKSHSLAPDSAEKQFRPLKRHFSQVKAAQRVLFADDQIQLDSFEGGGAIKVKKDEAEVQEEGRTRAFKFHRVKLKNGTARDCAYPSGGDGVVILPGAKVVEYI